MRFYPVLISVMAVVLLLFTGSSAAAAATAVNVSTGAFHTVVLISDGTVWTWGSADTNYGILGTGADQGDGSLRQVASLPTIKAIDANFKTSFAVDTDGRVWAWGDNEKGQCGNGQFADYSAPVLINGLKDIVQVSCGGLHCVALDKNGNVWVWGDNYYGQLGLGYSGAPQYTPVKLSIDNVKMVAAGMGYTVVLKNDGSVWAWGENNYGTTGSSEKENTLTPAKVSGLLSIVMIDAGYDHTLALRSDGTVWGWGDGKENNLLDGQGYNNPVFVNTPRQINSLPMATDIVAAEHCSMALGSDGNLYVWGSNGDGQYGNSIDLQMPEATAQKVPSMSDVVSMSAGLGHCVAIKKDGSVWAWGRNQEDQVQPGKGKKVMAPLKKLDGVTVAPGQQSTPAATTSASSATATASDGTDMVFYITAGGVVLLAIAVIGFILLLRMRK